MIKHKFNSFGTDLAGDYNDLLDQLSNSGDQDALATRSATVADVHIDNTINSVSAPALEMVAATNQSFASVSSFSSPVVLSNPAYDAYLGGTTGAAKDHGETDDPRTDGVKYSGTVYYIDSVGGNDNNSGTSPNQAWKTLEKAATKFDVGFWDTQAPNALTQDPFHDPWISAPSGSAFLFKRGGTYTGDIDVQPVTNGGFSFENDYTFGAYGDRNDARPVIINDATIGLRASPIEHFSINNLHFVGNSTAPSIGLFLNGSNGVSIVNTEVEGFTQDGITADGANNLTIQNSVFYNNSNAGYRGGGIAGGGVNTKILNSTFVNNGADQIGSHDAYLRNLTDAVIEGNLFVGGSNLGLVIHGTSDGITIRGNEFYGNSNGLSISGSGSSHNEVFNDVLIENNIIHDNGFRSGEQGYGMLLSSITNAVIRDNLIYGNRLGSLVLSDGSAGDQPSKNVQFYNNLFSGSVSVGGARTTNVAFENNIFTSPASALSAFALIKNSDLLNAQLTLDHNLYFMPNKAGNKVISYNNIATALSDLAAFSNQEKHGINADPLFVDASANNYALLPGSPAIDKGLAILGLISDFLGNPRPQGAGVDIGPFEFGPGGKGVIPLAPSIATFSTDTGTIGDHITSDNTLTLSGAAIAGSIVKVYDGGALLESTTASSGGSWSFTTAALRDGPHGLTAKATDAAGNTSAASAVFNVTIDTIAPAAPSIATFSTDTGTIGDHVTSDNTLTLSGAAIAGSLVKVYDGGALLGSTTASSSGSWSFTTAALLDGPHGLTAKATDAAGNTSAASAVFNVTIDTIAPAAPSIATFSTDTGTIGDHITSDNTLTLSGAAIAGSIVKAYDGGALLGSTTASSSGGSWSFTTAALRDGPHGLTAKATDAAGNTSAASAVFNVTIDTIAPAAPSIATFSTDTGTIGDHITSDNTLTLSGAAIAGSIVKVYDGGALLGSTTASSSSGSWNYATAALRDGPHGLTAKATDAAGNTSAASAVFNVTIDTIAPAAPSIATFSTDTGTIGDHITSDNTLTLSGAGAAGSLVKVYDGGALLGSTTAGSSGAWNYATAALVDGHHGFSAKAIDVAGNISAASAGLDVTIDTIAPAAPSIATFSTDTGTIGDHITSDNTLTLGGAAIAGSLVKVYDGGALLGSTTASSNGNWNYATAVLIDGHHGFSAKAIDVAGNISAASAGLDVTIDAQGGGGHSPGTTSHAPVVHSISTDIARNGTVAVSTLFSSTDSDGDAIAKFQFWDPTTSLTSGHFVLNGVAQAAQTLINVSAAQLAQTSFHAGTTADDHLMVREFDGIDWSDWTFLDLNTFNHVPVITPKALTAAAGTTVAVSMLFTTSDADDDPISYQFWDATTNVSSGHFILNGVAQQSQTIINVSPTQLSQTKFEAGSNTDILIVRAFDGSAWTDWQPIRLDLSPVHAASANAAAPTQIVGTNENDILRSTPANEVFTGGNGADTFVFNLKFGNDVINDFHASDANHDLIAFSQNTFKDFTAMLSHTAQAGSDVIISADASNAVTLHDVKLTELLQHPNVFEFLA